MPSLRKAVFFDRDGVLNKAFIKNGKPYPPASVNELIITEGSVSALASLKSAGFLLIGATNQPDVARGTTSRHLVEEINTALMKHLPLDEIRVCYHDDKDNCQCRKPLPGLLLDAAALHGINLKESVMIGDRWKDIAAGQAAGCKTIWINQHYDEQGPKQAPNFTTTNLRDAVNWITQTFNL